MLQGFGSFLGAACLSVIPVMAGVSASRVGSFEKLMSPLDRIPAAIRIIDKLTQDYDIAPMQWSGVIKEDGEILSFNGTVQEVEAQIRALNPGFALDQLAKPRRNLQKKAKVSIICDVGRDGAISTYPIHMGQSYLDSLQGNCGVPGGPRACSRISCSYDGAIWLCNDNPWPIHPKCSYLATYVADLLDRCGTDRQVQDWGYGHVQGQEFDTDNYNIIVGRTHC